VGSDETISVDARIVAATNKNLRQLIEQGTFREDLFYRLSVIHDTLPPLRERRD
jgi:transcriptional regulator with PAS, ATPase and Fis domain